MSHQTNHDSGADWRPVISPAASAAVAKYHKQHPRETESVLNNLKRLIARLNTGATPETVKFGFLRSEGGGLIRIGQTGIKNPCETRLYIVTRSRIVHVLGIGDKKSQQRDIRAAKSAAATLP